MKIAYLVGEDPAAPLVVQDVAAHCRLLSGRGHEVGVIGSGEAPAWLPDASLYHCVSRLGSATAFEIMASYDAVVATHPSQVCVVADVGTAAPFLLVPDQLLRREWLESYRELLPLFSSLPVSVLICSRAVRAWVERTGGPIELCDVAATCLSEDGTRWDGVRLEQALVRGVERHRELLPDSVTLGLAMIVRDEQENLRRCLASARPVVDEMVVVDTGSTDASVAVAEEFGARVVRYEWQQDFSAARNVSLACLSTDWVLVLDADERLAPSSYPFIRRALLNPVVDAFLIDIINVTGKVLVSGALAHSAVRLFRRRSAFRYEGRLHEQIAPSIVRAGGRIRPLPGASILHYGYLGAVVSDREKKQRNLAIIRRQVEEEPRNAFAHFNLAMEYVRQGDRARAIKAFQRSFRLLPGLDVSYAPALLKNLAACLIEEERYEEAHGLLQQAEEVYPEYVDLSYLRGVALNRMQRFEEALTALQKCLEKGEAPALYMTQVGAGSFLARMAMVDSYLGVARFDEAAEQYRLATREMAERLGEAVAAGRGAFTGDAARHWLSAESSLQTGDVPGAVAAYRELMRPEVRQELLPTQLMFLCQRKAVLEFIAGNVGAAREDVELLRGVSTRGANACASLLRVLGDERAVDCTVTGVDGTGGDGRGGSLRWEDVVVPLSTLLDAGQGTMFDKACRWLAAGPFPEGKLSLELGKLFFQRGWDTAAAQHLLASARAGTADAVAFWQLGELASRSGMPADARAFYRQAIRLAPKVPRYWLSLASSYHAAGRDSAGLRALNIARRHVGGELIQAVRLALEVSMRLKSRVAPGAVVGSVSS